MGTTITQLQIICDGPNCSAGVTVNLPAGNRNDTLFYNDVMLSLTQSRVMQEHGPEDWIFDNGYAFCCQRCDHEHAQESVEIG